MKLAKPLYVTQPALAPLEDFSPYLEKIWGSGWITNDGPFHEQLESALCDFLGVEHLSLFCNGTTALMAALRTLDLKGEVITTPYSFVATTHSLLWNGLDPVFVDIDPHTMNMDPGKIEAAISPETTAILPVHCYGRPCNTDEIERIAEKHGLKVIYDAAHAFNVEHQGSSILNKGDLSILSFHATKVFNTFEGGAIICPNEKTKAHVDRVKNFGFFDEITITTPGINGKMNELQAAFGLLQLKHIDKVIQQRKAIDSTYRKELSSVTGIEFLPEPAATKSNYSYFPILVTELYHKSRDELYQQLKDNNVFARRYFYPLISDMPMYRELPSAAAENLPAAEKIAQQVICLPIHPGMNEDLAIQVAGMIST